MSPEAREPATASVERFGKSTRWFHWTFGCAFLLLAASGAALALRAHLGLGPEAVARLLGVHLGAAVALVTAPLLVALSGDTPAVLADLRELLNLRRSDLRWLAAQPAALLRRAALPPVGKFNGGQKVNGLATVLLGGVLVATGVWLWLRPGSLLAFFVHLSAFLAWLPLFAAHLTLALVVPSTRPALRGMVRGRVSRAWAEHHHPLWVRALDGESSGDGPE